MYTVHLCTLYLRMTSLDECCSQLCLRQVRGEQLALLDQLHSKGTAAQWSSKILIQLQGTQ